MADDRAKSYSPLFPDPENSAGYNLYRLTGLRNRALYLNHSDRVNLIPAPMARWPVRHAWRAAENLMNSGVLRERLVILCGTKVQAAFGLAGKLSSFRVALGAEHAVVSIPHPSSYVWNDPAVVEHCREFMRRRVFPQLPDQAFRS